MHNNIMAAGSKDRPPMLGPGRYSQWRSRFLRYIDTKGNGEYLRKCIFEGPYKLTSVVIEVVAATVNSPEVPQHDEAETVHNMSAENKLYFQAEKEAIFLLLTGIGDEIYSTVDACNTANEMWIAIERLQQTSEAEVKMKLMNIRAERIAKSANPLALVAAAQPYSDHYYQAPKSQRSNAQASKQSSSTRPMNPNKLRGIRIMQKNLHSFQSNSRSSTNLPTSTFVLLQTLEQDVQIPHQVKDSEVRYLKNPVTEQPLEQGEATSCRDSCLVELQNKQTEFEKYKAFNDWTIDYEILQTNLNETLGLLARKIPYDTSDHANRFCPNGEETVTLEKESRSKLNKDTVKPYDYTYQNSLYEIFKPPSKTYLDQLERAKEVRKTMWRKTFVRTKPNIAKNVAFLPVSKSISKSRQAYNEMTNNFNHFRTICEQAWSNHTRSSFRNPTAHDMEVLIKSLLMPLSIKTINDSYCFVHELKTEMHEDFEYVKSLENEVDELESEKADFSNMYDLLLEECVSKDDLKAQMQDKNIAISELKKLIEKCKGKSVETQFDKPSVCLDNQMLQRIPKSTSVLGKPTPFKIS
ncbi:hypothetical protein Tco_0180551 [Tanacetum coccineum]